MSPTIPLEPTDLTRALAGQYEFEREVGRGGMGIVYLARDLKLDRRIAVKALPAHLARDSSVRERFLREARIAASLSHPNIVPVYRADELDGQVFFSMAYVDGASLAQQVKEHGVLPARLVLPVLRDVASALDYAHRHSVVHRDVKAENILIDRATGSALVTDFGVARILATASLTATGQLLGTVQYMAPEQVLGDTVDGRADLYALGVVGFYALSGRFPFEHAEPAPVLIGHATIPPPAVASMAPGLSPSVAAIIDRCLIKDPAARYQTGADMVRAINEALRDAVPPIPGDDRLRESSPRPPTMPSVITEEAAQGVWARAAELQAETGVHRRPPEIQAVMALISASTPGTAPRSGYRVSDVVDAAVEAGIGAEFVARAAVELGLVSPPAPAPRPKAVAPRSSQPLVRTSTSEPAVPTVVAHPSKWLGAPLVFDIDIRVEGEVPDRELDFAIDAIRRTVGKKGKVSVVGRSVIWSTGGPQRHVTVSIVRRAGNTIVRAEERLGSLAGGLFGGVVAGLGAPLTMAALMVGIEAMHSPAAGLFFGGAAISSVYAFARGLYASSARRRSADLQRLLSRLAEHFRETATESKGEG